MSKEKTDLENAYAQPVGLCLTDRIISDAKKIREQACILESKLKDHIPDVKEMVSPNDGWIKGNEPDEEGSYELTFKGCEAKKSFVETGYYDIGRWLQNSPKAFNRGEWTKANIIAYKPLKLSAPYVEPERELRCPFCDRRDVHFAIKDMFCCEDCEAIIPAKSKETIFEIYDKLNGGE